jgi:hypothetical protein
MKRIQSLDILRGVAMLGLVFMHAVEKVGFHSVVDDIFDQPWYVFLPLGILMYFASWRGFFLIISGIGSAFSFQKAVQKGNSPHVILLRRVIFSIILFWHGVLIQFFFNPYTGLYYIFTGDFTGISWSTLTWSDAVQIIAVGLLLSSIIHYIFLVFWKKRKNLVRWIAISFFIVCMVLVFVLKPYVIQALLDKAGLSSIDAIWQSADSFSEGVKWIPLAVLIGRQEPFFPYMASYFLGSAIGIALTHPKVAKKNVLITGYGLGLIFGIVAILVGAFKDNFYVGSEMIPSDWFLYLATAIQLWVLTSFLWIFDFAKKSQTLTKYTKTIRKAGILSITIFTLQSIDFVPRWILMKITGLDFLSNGGHLSIGNALLAGIVVLVFWITLILLWGLINYTLSVDWLFDVIRQLLSGQKINWKDPIRSRDIIFNAEIPFEREIDKEQEEGKEI